MGTFWVAKSPFCNSKVLKSICPLLEKPHGSTQKNMATAGQCAQLEVPYQLSPPSTPTPMIGCSEELTDPFLHILPQLWWKKLPPLLSRRKESCLRLPKLKPEGENMHYKTSCFGWCKQNEGVRQAVLLQEQPPCPVCPCLLHSSFCLPVNVTKQSLHGKNLLCPLCLLPPLETSPTTKGVASMSGFCGNGICNSCWHIMRPCQFFGAKIKKIKPFAWPPPNPSDCSGQWAPNQTSEKF